MINTEGSEEEKALALLLRGTFALLRGKSLTAMDDFTKVFSICDDLSPDSALTKKVLWLIYRYKFVKNSFTFLCIFRFA